MAESNIPGWVGDVRFKKWKGLLRMLWILDAALALKYGISLLADATNPIQKYLGVDDSRYILQL
ncbi:hypothetical protein N7451_004777 [Penicillium sp. IBT 35674x]|nr:hypothetical protein N7451_004777 [Penicillium sp. IBT 35674x]